MITHRDQCTCGSNLPAMMQFDARGIPLTFTCTRCHQAKMGGYRRDVLNDPNYWHDEPIEEDRWE